MTLNKHTPHKSLENIAILAGLGGAGELIKAQEIKDLMKKRAIRY